MPFVLISPEQLLDQPGPWVDLLREAKFDIRYPRNPLFTRGGGGEDETISELAGAVAVIAGGEHLSRKAIESLPDLKVIARAGVGFDRVDIPTATRRGIPVTITPTANHQAVAEHALALILAVAKKIVWADMQTRLGHWPRVATAPIRGRTLGVLGLGRIGRSTAVRAMLLGMKVIATEPFPNAAFVRANPIELVDFETLLARSDIVSIHSPLNEETRGLFNARVFAKMKPGAVLVNTARGGLVVEKDLIPALASGHLGGAGLDVFEQEPPSPDNPLFRMDNVVVSPHWAGTDSQSMADMAVECAECIVKLHRGEWPEGAVVNDELRATFRW